MSITLKFEDEAYLPGLGHQLVQTLRENKDAELIGVESNTKGLGQELLFGLDGAESEDDRLLITDVQVLVAAKEYCHQHEPEFKGELLKHQRAAAYMIDEQTTPVFASSRVDADGHGAPGAEA